MSNIPPMLSADYPKASLWLPKPTWLRSGKSFQQARTFIEYFSGETVAKELSAQIEAYIARPEMIEYLRTAKEAEAERAAKRAPHLARRGPGKSARHTIPKQRWLVNLQRPTTRAERVWCRDNCQGHWTDDWDAVTFKLEDDASLFAMFVGAPVVDRMEDWS